LQELDWCKHVRHQAGYSGNRLGIATPDWQSKAAALSQQ
jgi:hypothetical protein